MARVDCLFDVKTFVKDSFVDNRGELYTIWKDTDTPSMDFNHDKLAISNQNVLRGLHTDKSWKLITSLYGKIQLVVVNFNKESSELFKSNTASIYGYGVGYNFPLGLGVRLNRTFFNLEKIDRTEPEFGFFKTQLARIRHLAHYHIFLTDSGMGVARAS
jgi:hypothetical protein